MNLLCKKPGGRLRLLAAALPVLLLAVLLPLRAMAAMSTEALAEELTRAEAVYAEEEALWETDQPGESLPAPQEDAVLVRDVENLYAAMDAALAALPATGQTADRLALARLYGRLADFVWVTEAWDPDQTGCYDCWGKSLALYAQAVEEAGLPADYAAQDLDNLEFVCSMLPYSRPAQQDACRELLEQLLALEPADGPLHAWYQSDQDFIDGGYEAWQVDNCVPLSLCGSDTPLEVGSGILLDDYTAAPQTGTIGEHLYLWLPQIFGALGAEMDETTWPDADYPNSMSTELYGKTYRFTEGAGEAEVAGAAVALSRPIREQDGELYIKYEDFAALTGWEAALTEDDAGRALALDFTPPAVAAMSEEQQDFFAGIGAPLNLLNMGSYLNYYDPGMVESPEYTPMDMLVDFNDALTPLYGYPVDGWAGESRKILAESWGVSGRQGLIGQLESLLSVGQRAAFKRETGSRPDWFTQKWGSRAKEDRALLGWDMGRAVMLGQWGCCAGYLAPEEALGYMLRAAVKLQENFTSWEDFGQDYLMGFDRYLNSDSDYDEYGSARVFLVENCYFDNLYRGTAWTVALDDLNVQAALPDAAARVDRIAQENAKQNINWGEIAIALPCEIGLAAAGISLAKRALRKKKRGAGAAAAPAAEGPAEGTPRYIDAKAPAAAPPAGGSPAPAGETPRDAGKKAGGPPRGAYLP